MFTGLVQSLATIQDLIPEGPGIRLVVEDAETADKSAIGDSVAINGCCLTVIGTDDHLLSFDAGPETLMRTNLGKLTPGSQVNLETPLALGDALGGHLVTGHIDGLGIVNERIDDEQWSTIWYSASDSLMRQMASKGSIAVDGVSLTLVDVEEDRFSVALIPHTLQVTTLGLHKRGDQVNLETDVLAKYVERQLEYRKE